MTTPLKKMFLLSPELLDKLNNRPDLRADALEKKIKTTLRSRRRLPAEKRLNLLRKYQGPYLRMLREKRKPIELTYIDNTFEPRSIVKRKKKIRQTKRPLPSLSEIPEEEEQEEEKDGEYEDMDDGEEDIPKFIDDGDVFENKGYTTPTRNETDKFTAASFGDIAGKYISPYIRGASKIDHVFGIRKDGDEFKIGQSRVMVEDNDIFIKGVQYQGTPGLWELITKNNVNTDLVNKEDLAQYKRILQQTKAHLDKKGKIKSSRGEKYTKIVSRLFPTAKRKWTSVA